MPALQLYEKQTSTQVLRAALLKEHFQRLLLHFMKAIYQFIKTLDAQKKKKRSSASMNLNHIVLKISKYKTNEDNIVGVILAFWYLITYHFLICFIDSRKGERKRQKNPLCKYYLCLKCIQQKSGKIFANLLKIINLIEFHPANIHLFKVKKFDLKVNNKNTRDVVLVYLLLILNMFNTIFQRFYF